MPDAYSHGTNDYVCKSFSDDIVSWLSSELSAQIFTLSGISRLDFNTVCEFIAYMTFVHFELIKKMCVMTIYIDVKIYLARVSNLKYRSVHQTVFFKRALQGKKETTGVVNHKKWHVTTN